MKNFARPGGTSQNSGTAQIQGYIFMCNNDSERECLESGLFGLPKSNWNGVKHITPGMPLFLFNLSQRRMHGVFKASSPGGLDINPTGWCKPNESKTKYPAQVRY